MSTTFTFPVAAGDQFEHGHQRRHSHHRSHHRNSRLAPPFPLPRIASGIVNDTNDIPDTHSHVQDDHNRSSHHSNVLIASPKLDLNGPLSMKKRSFDITKPNTFQPPSTAKVAMTRSYQHRHVSRPTDLLLQATESYSLLHGILADPQSRRIFYFMMLNLTFMGVQSTYGFLTGSLGLISDSIHMFFDCVALFVGVCAAVMSKWPPSAKFPYGYGKIDTLAGLGNGIFLMLISVEIAYEAIERLFTGSDLSRTTELLVVSMAGLLVNMVGIFAFHGHHGHSHDHGHGAGHNHNHTHSHDHSDSHKHEHEMNNHGHEHVRRLSNAASASPIRPNLKPDVGSHGHHHHGTENMQGIYLHILADALGSVAVVISTVLVRFTGWSGFDPLASFIIAVLIFVSSVPLVSSTTKTLLLSLDSDVEYNLRDILGGVSAIRGVAGYSVPKFWLENVKKEVDAHGHGHSHSQSHEHPHGHSHSESHSHRRRKVSDGSDSSHSDDDHSRNHHHEDDLTVLGVIHVIVGQTADLNDVKVRVEDYFRARKMDVIVQYEREGETRCWCGGAGGGQKTG